MYSIYILYEISCPKKYTLTNTSHGYVDGMGPWKTTYCPKTNMGCSTSVLVSQSVPGGELGIGEMVFLGRTAAGLLRDARAS